MRDLYNRCARVYVPSSVIGAELESHGITRLEILPHGVDTETFSPAHRSDAWIHALGVGARQRILWVGRLVPEKDLATLIQVHGILTRRRSDWVMIVVGDGPSRKEMEAAMPGAIFTGHRSGQFLSAAYASSDLFLFPSPTETFGNVVLEAMASGSVPVCVREGGAQSSVRDGVTGLIANPRDPADIARCVEMLLDSAGRRSLMRAAALAYARGETWEQVFDRQFKSYGEVVALSSRSPSGGGPGSRTRTGPRGSSRPRTPRWVGTPRRVTRGRSRTWQ